MHEVCLIEAILFSVLLTNSIFKVFRSGNFTIELFANNIEVHNLLCIFFRYLLVYICAEFKARSSEEWMLPKCKL